MLKYGSLVTSGTAGGRNGTGASAAGDIRMVDIRTASAAKAINRVDGIMFSSPLPVRGQAFLPYPVGRGEKTIRQIYFNLRRDVLEPPHSERPRHSTPVG